MTQATKKPLSTAELAAWRGLLSAHSSIIAELDEDLVRDHELPLTSYEVLLQLANAEGRSLRMGELADRLYLSRSGLTRLIDRLVKAGLVERTDCESDRRGSYARLTDAGAERFEKARPTHLEGIRRHFLGHLDDRDLADLARVWSKAAEGRSR